MSISNLVVLKIKVTLIQVRGTSVEERLMHSMVLIVHLTRFDTSNPTSAWCHTVGTHHSVQSCPSLDVVFVVHVVVVFIGVQTVTGAGLGPILCVSHELAVSIMSSLRDS
jgi:hypothetical protein